MQSETQDTKTPDMPDRVRVRRKKPRNPIQRFFKKLRKTLKWQVVVASLLVIVIVPTVIAMALATDANARVQDSRSNLLRILNTVSAQPIDQLKVNDVNRLTFGMDSFVQDIERAQAQTGFLHLFASFSPDLEVRLAMLDVAHDIALGAKDMLTGSQPSLFLLLGKDDSQNGSLEFSSTDRLVELLKIGQGSFVSASQHLAEAKKKLDALRLEQVSPDLLLIAEDLIRYQQQAVNINQLLMDGPDLLTKALGLDEPQDYLVLSQNSDELRPSGGYISTWGWMRVRRAKVIDYAYSPTTITSPNPPPEDMVSELHIPDWWIKYKKPIYAAFDGSWYADFASTAQLTAWFYDNGNNPRSPVDGVIGIDVVGFEYLLGSIGNVTVSDYNETVNAENFREVIYKIRESGEGDLPHKRFLSALYKQIFAQWQQLPPERGSAFFNAVLKALQEKHLIIYFKDEQLNRVIDQLGWSGVQHSDPSHDFLMVADANLGSKSNRSIARQITYDVEIQPEGTLQSRASIAYDFPAEVAHKDPAFNPANYNDINYFNIMQVFVPAGTQLGETKNLQSEVTVNNTDKYTDFVTLTEVKFDSTQRYQMSYTTPMHVETFGNYRRYRLLLQKQAGMISENAQVQVTLPPGAKLISANPEPTTSFTLDKNIIEFHVQLKTDVWIEVLYTQ